MSSKPQTNLQTINAFIDRWSNQDIEGIMSFFAADAVYTNIPIDPPNIGEAAIRETITGFVTMANKIEFIVHHESENADGVVMNERTDRFLIGEKWIEIAVMGIFELRDGKIVNWRDYFDMAKFNEQM